MLVMSWATLIMMRRNRGVDGLNPWLLRGLVGMTFSGWLATLAGWYTTEIGRQPWLVQGVLTTEAAVADVPAPMVATTLAAYLIVYAVLLVAYITVIFRLARKASNPEDTRPHSGAAQVALVPAE
jgi:cytochrome d ubiquinol oxidase subunit I